MTVIVGITENDEVWIGGDSAGTSPHDFGQSIRLDPKVIENGPALIGFCGSFRMGQLLGYTLRVPKLPEGGVTMSYMVNDFITAVRRLFRDAQFSMQDFGPFIVGIDGRMFTIYADFQVAEEASGFSAVGSGAGAAIGSLQTTRGMPAQDRLAIALAVAEEDNAAVRGPFTIKVNRKNSVSED